MKQCCISDKSLLYTNLTVQFSSYMLIIWSIEQEIGSFDVSFQEICATAPFEAT